MPSPTTAERWTDAADPRRRIGRAVEFVPVIGSTNDRARDLLAEPDGAGVAVVADLQTAGRGRHHRSWASPAGRNLTLSVGVLPSALPAVEAWMLSAVTALAVLDAARPHAELALAWPNDVVAAVDGRKVAGILVETTLAGERVRDAVIGVGLNVNWRRADMPDELRPRATSLAELAGRAIDRVELLGSLLGRLDAELVGLEDGESPLERYRQACITLGTHVRVDAPGGPLEGRATAIDDRGALVVTSTRGTVAVTSGEVVRLTREVPA
jgi:BirA family biotin operon repressor/biotin-[acetyl-CoA-carboxylase] ligase